MNKVQMRMFSVFLVSTLFFAVLVYAKGGGFSPAPKTAYAREFIEKCQGQQWLLDEVESILNSEQKTINTITSSADLNIVKSLGFTNRNIGGFIPKAIGEFKELRYLFLSGNKFSGSIPEELYTLPKIENIDLSDNKYSIEIPKKLGMIPSLKALNLQGNEFKGEIPMSFYTNSKLEIFDVSSNKLTGEIPDTLSQMTGLKYLALSDNGFSGKIPDVSGLKNLITFSAWGCGFTGQIPAGIYSLTKLEILDLANNKLTGTINSSIGNLSNIRYISLGNNQLTGNIPNQIGNMNDLMKLDFADNLLRGTIPDVFAGKDKLEDVHLENNFLRGHVPDSLKAKYDDGVKVFLQNNSLTGDNLKNMENNEDNFCDGAGKEQFQLTISTNSYKISKDSAVNIYNNLSNKYYGNPSNKPKEILLPDEYEVTVISGDARKIKIETNTSGIFLTALDEIKAADKISIEVRIKDNTGSDYSKTVISVATESISGGGGGGGGGGTPTPIVPPEEPVIPVEPAGDIPVHEPYISGYPDGSFRPTGFITREEVAVVLTRALNEKQGFSASYTDVNSSRWSYGFIANVSEKGYMKGYPDGSFKPKENITRAEFATCMAQIVGLKDVDESENIFSDVKASTWYFKFVLSAYKDGIIAGYEDKTFRPENPITRTEAVTMMNAVLKRDLATARGLRNKEMPFNDVFESYWGYLQIKEAAVTHEH